MRGDLPYWIIGVLLAIAPVFFVPLILYIFAALGVGMTAAAVILFRRLIERAYPEVVRVWVMRNNGFTIRGQSRAKYVKIKQVDYLQTIAGNRFKAPENKYVVQGLNADYIDILDKQGEHLPMLAVAVKGGLKLQIIPEDQRYIVANQIEENVEVTTPESSPWLKMAPYIMLVVVGMTAMAMIVMFLQEFPKYTTEMMAPINANTALLNSTASEFREAAHELAQVLQEYRTSSGTGGGSPPPPF